MTDFGDDLVPPIRTRQGISLATEDIDQWFQNAPVPMHSMDAGGLLIGVNKEWVAFTGHAAVDAIGHSFSEFLEAASAKRYLDAAVPEIINEVPADQKRSVEYRLVRKNGHIADIVLTARPIRDPATNRFVRSLAVISDITARNRAEAALRQSQKIDALGSLTGGVAHDFNNLLMVILSNLAMLEKKLSPLDPGAEQFLRAAVDAAQRGAALIRRMLAFARQQPLAPDKIDPATLFGGLEQLLSRSLGPSVRIVAHAPPDVWPARADLNQLEMALINLAINARDAMPEGGVLTIAARNEVVAPTAPSAFFADDLEPDMAPGDYVVITVADEGVGMDELTLRRATDPFFTTKGIGKGTGMGLSMVHGFAVQSGGTLRIHSQPGSGTRVEVWLRRSHGSTPDRSIESLSPSAATDQLRPLRVVLVDDDALVRMGTKAMLEELGHSVTVEAGSGAEALHALEEVGDVDLLLTDQAMPGMTGSQLAQAASALRPKLRVLLATGYSDIQAETSVPWPLLPKPYGLEELAAALGTIAKA
jgi:PAS domain S-box-containing protein